MGRVYSQYFMNEASASGDYTYEVPPGYRAVVRQIAMTAGISPDDQNMTLYSDVGGRIAYLSSGGPTASIAYAQLELRLVYDELDVMRVHVNGTIDFYVGGYLLSLP